MSHAENKATQPDGAAPALCSGGLVSLRLTPSEIAFLKRVIDGEIERGAEHEHYFSVQRKLWGRTRANGAETNT